MKKYFLNSVSALVLSAAPFLAFAQDKKTLADVVGTIIDYFEVAIVLIISLAVVTFIWNVYRYFFIETEKRKEAGLYVMYSVIGFFVILSFWGLVAILDNSLKLPNREPSWPFGVGRSGQQQTPFVPTGVGAGDNTGIVNPWDH